MGRARGLKDETLAVGRPVGLGILASVGELADICEALRGSGGGQEGGKDEVLHIKTQCTARRVRPPRATALPEPANAHVAKMTVEIPTLRPAMSYNLQPER